ncbi:MAG: SCO family protein [Pseudomonadota bacterium]
MMKHLIPAVALSGLAAVSFAAVVAVSPQQTASNATTPEPTVTVAASLPKVTSQPSATAKEPETKDVAGEQIAQLPDNFLPFGQNIGGDFDLIDHFGEPRQLEDYRGKFLMIFFGYANCEAICSAALPLMADTVTHLGDKAGTDVIPLMITVDPENDTPDLMRKRLGEYHPSLIGMTGSDGALADVRAKFNIRVENVGEDISGNPIYNHGSYIYLLGANGEFKTLMPPVLEPKQMADIVAKYIEGDKGNG